MISKRVRPTVNLNIGHEIRCENMLIYFQRKKHVQQQKRTIKLAHRDTHISIWMEHILPGGKTTQFQSQHTVSVYCFTAYCLRKSRSKLNVFRENKEMWIPWINRRLEAFRGQPLSKLTEKYTRTTAFFAIFLHFVINFGTLLDFQLLADEY